MWIKQIIMAGLGVCSGLMVAGGVFTVLFIVGLVPRFAGKTDTARYEILYEEFIIAGSIVGCILSVFKFPYLIGELLKQLPHAAYMAVTLLALIIIGIFSGMFVGCLSLALAEILDSIPIFTRRIGFRHGIGIVVISIAFGKLLGSLLYFGLQIFGK